MSDYLSGGLSALRAGATTERSLIDRYLTKECPSAARVGARYFISSPPRLQGRLPRKRGELWGGSLLKSAVILGSQEADRSGILAGPWSSPRSWHAAAACARHVTWLQNLFLCPGFPQDGPTQIYCDNQAAISLTKDFQFHSKSKHIDIHHHFIRDKVSDGTLTVSYVPGEENPADLLTKGLARVKHEKFTRENGLMPAWGGVLSIKEWWAVRAVRVLCTAPDAPGIHMQSACYVLFLLFIFPF